MANYQPLNRQEIRHSVGRNVGDVIVGEAESTVDTSSLIDITHLTEGDDAYNGREVMMYDPAGSIVAGEKSRVTDFTGFPTSDATCSPVFSASITDGDKYEMWKALTVDEVNDVINQAIIAVASRALINRIDDTNFTLPNKSQYDWLTPYTFGNDFRAVSKLEYVKSIGVEKVIHNCDAVWDELVDGDVTASLDNNLEIEGSGCLKLVVAAGAGATDILATDAIISVDLYDCDQIEIWVRSTVALDAGDLQVLLDATASCASPLESLDIPATSANTGTHHVISLANAHLDGAIISVGIKMVTDKGAFTLYVDRIRAVDSQSKKYVTLAPEYWSLVGGSSPVLKFTATGKGLVGNNTQVRLTGYSTPDVFSDDTTDAEVNPNYLIAKATGQLLIGHAKSSRLEVDDRDGKAKYWLSIAEGLKQEMTVSPVAGTRWVHGS